MADAEAMLTLKELGREFGVQDARGYRHVETAWCISQSASGGRIARWRRLDLVVHSVSVLRSRTFPIARSAGAAGKG